MKCEQIKNILLTESRSDIESEYDPGFTEHIGQCADCKKYLSTVTSIEQSAVHFDQIKDELNYERISNIVMEKIQHEKDPAKLALLAKISELLFNPFLKFSYALLLTGLFIWYFHTEYTDHSKLVNLETRLNILDDSETLLLPFNSVSLASFSNVINKLTGLVNENNFDESKLFINSGYKELLQMLIKSEVRRNESLKTFLAKNKINVSDGINSVEFVELLKKHDEITAILGIEKGGI